MRCWRKQISIIMAFAIVLTMFFEWRGALNIAAAARPALNKKKVRLTVGKTVQLRVKNKRGTVKWRSSNKNVITVSGRGLVRAKAKGNAKITAKTGKYKLTCRVAVAAKQAGTKAGGASSATAQPAQSNQDTTKQYQQEVLSLVNKERAAGGLDPMVLDETLCDMAMARADEITKVFSHTRPDGRDCFSIFQEFGIQYRAVGENIAAGQQTPAGVMDSWMNSQGHRENIMSSEFHKLGVGCVNTTGGYGSYWVQLFSN